MRRLLTGRGLKCLQTLQGSGLSRLANAASSGVLPKPLVGLQTRICAFRHIDSISSPCSTLLAPLTIRHRTLSLPVLGVTENIPRQWAAPHPAKAPHTGLSTILEAE